MLHRDFLKTCLQSPQYFRSASIAKELEELRKVDSIESDQVCEETSNDGSDM